MRVIKEIPIRNIVVDRFSISPQTLSLCDFIRLGGEIPPIKIEKKDGKYILKNGRHRITAYRLLGLETIKCKLYEINNSRKQ